MRLIVTIGCSAGGIQALKKLLLSWPYHLDMAVIIVQHIGKDAPDLSVSFQRFSKWPICQAEHNQKIETQHIYIAPADYHVLVEREGTLSLSYEEKVSFTRPAIDVLFSSTADAYGKQMVAILLTGANQDGTQGCQKVKDCGGLTIAQDPQEAEVPVMPQSAIEAGVIDYIGGLDEIAMYLNDLGENT